MATTATDVETVVVITQTFAGITIFTGPETFRTEDEAWAFVDAHPAAYAMGVITVQTTTTTRTTVVATTVERHPTAAGVGIPGARTSGDTAEQDSAKGQDWVEGPSPDEVAQARAALYRHLITA